MFWMRKSWVYYIYIGATVNRLDTVVSSLWMNPVFSKSMRIRTSSRSVTMADNNPLITARKMELGEPWSLLALLIVADRERSDHDGPSELAPGGSVPRCVPRFALERGFRLAKFSNVQLDNVRGLVWICLAFIFCWNCPWITFTLIYVTCVCKGSTIKNGPQKSTILFRNPGTPPTVG